MTIDHFELILPNLKVKYQLAFSQEFCLALGHSRPLEPAPSAFAVLLSLELRVFPEDYEPQKSSSKYHLGFDLFTDLYF